MPKMLLRPTSKGREGNGREGEEKGREREGKGGSGRGEGRGRDKCCPPNLRRLATPLKITSISQ